MAIKKVIAGSVKAGDVIIIGETISDENGPRVKVVNINRTQHSTSFELSNGMLIAVDRNFSIMIVEPDPPLPLFVVFCISNHQVLAKHVVAEVDLQSAIHYIVNQTWNYTGAYSAEKIADSSVYTSPTIIVSTDANVPLSITGLSAQ